MSWELVYFACLGVGLTYALLSVVLGWLFGHGHGDVHLDAGGHLEMGHPHPISGNVIATFLSGFGAAGIIAERAFDWSVTSGLVFSLLAGAALAAAALGVMSLIFSHTQAGSEFRSSDAVGRSAEVITPIPADGVGEVAYLVKGQRELASARIAGHGAAAKGSHVTIETIEGPTAWVRLREPLTRS